MKSRANKSRKNTTRKQIPLNQCNYHSIHNLNHWIKHEYTHLAWNYLAKKKGIHEKVSAYKNSLSRLECSIDYMMKSTKSAGDISELKMMKENLTVLQELSRRVL